MAEGNSGLPRVIGGYELVEKLGDGGMASLFLARRAGARGFVRPVAVKVVHRHLVEDPDFVQMFIDEGNLCSRLSHPNIVHVEELGEANGELYLVMELVDGCSLGGLLSFMRKQNERIPLSLAVHIIRQVADGLHAAHEATDDDGLPLDLVHRDVSPSNILLSRRGHVKIIDFGIAKSIYRQHHTRARKLKGKVAYMSPEQLQRQHLDRRSDIYSLGVVLWETLANMRAFRAEDDVSLIRLVATNPIPPIDAIRDDLPDELLVTLSTALHRQREHRFSTAWEFWQALAAAVPEALYVTSGDVGEQIERVLEARGGADSVKRVRETSSYSDSQDFATVTPPPVEVSEVPEAAASSYPNERGKLGFAYDVGRVLLLLACLIGAVVWYLWPAPTVPSTQAETPVAAPAPAPAPSPAPPAAAPEPEPAAEAPAEVAAESEPEPEPEPSAAEPEPATDRAAPTEAAEGVEPAPPPRRRTAARRTTPRRRRANPTPANSQAIPTDLLEDDAFVAPAPAAKTSARRPESSGARVGDVLLADEHDLDKATSPKADKGRPKVVEEGDSVLADEYQ